MTYPAWFDLHRDPVVTRRPVALRVYAALVAERLAFDEPRPVKAWALAAQLHVTREAVIAALATLIARGFLTDCGRGANNVRLVQITFQRGSTRKPTASAA